MIAYPPPPYAMKAKLLKINESVITKTTLTACPNCRGLVFGIFYSCTPCYCFQCLVFIFQYEMHIGREQQGMIKTSWVLPRRKIYSLISNERCSSSSI